MVNKIRRWLMRFTNPLLFLVMVLVPISSLSADEEKQAPSNSSATHHHINIPSTNLAAALNALAKQTQALFMFPYDIAETRPAKSVTGRYTILEALEIILKDSGLASDLSEKGVIKIYLDDASANNQGKRNMNTKKNLLASTIAFFMGSAVQGVVAQEDVGGQEENGWALEEIVVTAQKQGEVGLQDTPMSISVLSADTIDKRGLSSMDDYLTTIPGVSFVQGNVDIITIRGISSGVNESQSTAGAYFGEIPMSSAAVGAFDIRLVDVERVEVLKGPHGTLYGSNALSGIIRSIPASPNLESIKASVRFSGSSQSETNNNNSLFDGVLNIPLVEGKLALRAAGYQYNHAGYVDSISSEKVESVAGATNSRVIIKDDIGGKDVAGGRVIMLWMPNEQTEASITFGAQDEEKKGSSQEVFSLGGYNVNYVNMENGRNDSSETEYGNFSFQYDFGWAKLVSASSVMKSDKASRFNMINFTSNEFFQPTINDSWAKTDVFSQEVRMASSLNGPVQYVVGLFYEDVEQTVSETVENPISSTTIIGGDRILDYRQKAMFGELAYQFNELWELTLGARYFDYDRVDTNAVVSSLFGIDTHEELNVGEAGDTFMANVSYTPNDNSLIYLKWSEGFRLGRGQALPNPSLCDVNDDNKLDHTSAVISNRLKADTTENFEVGAKFTLLDNRFIVNTSLFLIDWSDLPALIQSTTSACFDGIYNNIGEAYSEGIEVEATYAMSPHLTLNLTASYNDTEWKKAIDPIMEGEELGLAPNTSAMLGLQYDFNLGFYSSFFRADLSYVGEFETSNQAAGFPTAGDYVNLNLRLGAKSNQWSVAIYSNNVTNEDSITSAISTDLGYRISPREIGIDLEYDF